MIKKGIANKKLFGTKFRKITDEEEHLRLVYNFIKCLPVFLMSSVSCKLLTLLLSPEIAKLGMPRATFLAD